MLESRAWKATVWVVLGALGALGGCAPDPEPAREAAPAAAMEQRDGAVVYGEDNRTDLYAYPGAELRDLTEASIVALMRASDIDDSDPGNIRFNAQPLGQAFGLCSDQRFWDQPTAGLCSGTLIDDDLVLTAGHCVTNQRECEGLRYVFNYTMQSESELTTVTSDDVFSCSRLVVQELNSNTGQDYAIVQLDRPVSLPKRPAPVKVADEAMQVGASVTVIGFGSGIPAKIDDGGEVVDRGPATRDFFRATTDTFGGNSGSGAFDASGELVGILVRGAPDYAFDARRGCNVVNELADGGVDGGEDLTYAKRAIDALCASGFSSPRLCESGGTGSWCDPCVTADECEPGWQCRAADANPDARTCVPSCNGPQDCRVDHACVAGVCRPAIARDVCFQGDVWGEDVCGNRQAVVDACTDAEVCQGGQCAPVQVGPSDLAVLAEDLVLRPNPVLEGELSEVVVTVRNLGETGAASPIRLRVQLTNAATGETQALPPTTINRGVAAGARVVTPIGLPPLTAGAWTVQVRLVGVAEGDPTNDIAAALLNVEAVVLDPPEVVGLTAIERGDGDGRIESDEAFDLVWDVEDRSGSGIALLEVRENGALIGAPDGGSLRVGPLAPGTYTFQVTARDNAGGVGSAEVVVEVFPVEVSTLSVLTTTPQDGAVDVSPNTAITATFDRALAPNQSAGVFRVTAPGGATVAGTARVSADGSRLTFTPSAPLSEGATYSVRVAGAVGAGGEPQASVATWSFTVADEVVVERRVELTAPSEGERFGAGTIVVRGSVTGAGLSGYRVTAGPLGEDGAEVIAGNSAVVGGELGRFDAASVPDGPTRLTLSADFGAGVVEESVTVVIDTTPPDVYASALFPEDLTTDTEGSARLLVGVRDASSEVVSVEVQYTIDGSDQPWLPMRFVGGESWQINTPPFDWASLGGASLVWRVRAVDALGNRVETPTESELIDPVNRAPVWAELPTVVVDENLAQNQALDLRPLISDPDHATANLTLAVTANSPLARVDLTAGRFVSVTPVRNATGAVLATVVATDPSGAQAVGALRIEIRPDVSAPVPNPSAWSARPAESSPGVATMTARTAADPGGVEYFFEELSGNPGGDSSGWQSAPTYTDAGLQPGRAYRYRVRTRDLSSQGNSGAWSPTAELTTAGTCDVCPSGARRCDDDAVEVCRLDGRGCTEWAVVTTCQGGTVCEDAACVPVCEDACDRRGERACVSEVAFRVCGQFDGDPCLEWSDPEPCAEGDACTPEANAECVTICPGDDLEPSAEGDPRFLDPGWYSGLTLCDGDDVYVVDVDAAQGLELSVWPEGPNTGIWVELYDASTGELVDRAEAERGEEVASVSWGSRNAARLEVRVQASDPDTAQYTLRVERVAFAGDACEAGAQECLDETGYRVCADLNADGFVEWSGRMDCPLWHVCGEGGVCDWIERDGERPEEPEPADPGVEPNPADPGDASAPAGRRDVSTCATAPGTPSTPAPAAPLALVFAGAAMVWLRRRR